MYGAFFPIQGKIPRKDTFLLYEKHKMHYNSEIHKIDWSNHLEVEIYQEI